MRSTRKVWLVGLLGLLAFCSMLAVPAQAARKTEKQLLEERRVVARWHINGHGQFEEAHRLGLDVWEEHLNPQAGFFTVMITDSQLVSLRQAGYNLEVTNPDYYQSLQVQALVPNGGFRTWEQCSALMDSIHTAHPTITTARFALGPTMTYEGRFLYAMKISDNPDVNESEPEVLFTGMHHAREPIGMEICLETMKRLTDGYGTDTMLTRLVNERQIYFVPVVNPDGYAYNYLNYPNGYGMWRKNRFENSNGTFGVDLNRNYGYNWGFDNNGSSPTPADDTYRGVAAFSELETQIMRAFINAHQFVFDINYHSYSNLFLWPWGYAQIYSPDDAFFTAVGDSFVSFNGFVPQIGWRLYVTNGDADDWGYGATSEHPKMYSFTPEVGTSAEGTSGNGFWPQLPYIPLQIAKCQGSNMVIIDLADTPERIYPPVMPTWTAPSDTVTGGDYTLGWSDPGGLNGAVSYKLEELYGGQVKIDSAESGMGNWISQGFALSTAQYSSFSHSFYGGNADGLNNSMTANFYYHVKPNDTLKAKIWWDIETDWDYAYVEASTDGGAHFTPLNGNVTTGTNPHGNNRGNGITGTSGGAFTNAVFPLNALAGQDVLFRLSYETDEFTTGVGVYFDDVSPVQVYDSVLTRAAALSATTFPVTGKPNGSYRYRLTSTDAQGQKSKVTSPKEVTVMSVTRGDMNNDGARDIMDVVGLIDYIFSNGPGPVIPGAEECNCVPGVDVMDLVMLIDNVFRGGPEPNCP